MEKVKSVLHSNKEDPESSTSAGPTGRMTGQGSHFPQAEDTIPPGGAAGLDTHQSARQNPDDGLGTAAIGTTSTYSSHHLAKGDPVGNVADPQSADPTTYKMPEHMYGSSSTGVPEGAAGTAASLAFNKDRQQSTSQIPGAFPKDESSPYDSTRAASAATSGFTGSGATRDPYGSRGLEAASGGAAGTGGSSGLGQGISAAAAGVATENALSRGGTSHDATTIAPSGLTSTTSPADRSADYGVAENTKVPDETATGSNQSGTFGKILGAMGLGAAAGGATAAATKGTDNEKTDVVSGTPNQPTTTTGVSSYTAPTESTSSTAASQPPTHYRKESIPTSAYPAGQDSPAPINPPIGGTAAAINEPEHKDHTGRNAGFAAAGVGAGALGAHELGKQKSEPGEINEYNIGSSAQNTTPAAPYAPATSTGTDRGMGQSQTTATPYHDSHPESDSKNYGKTAATAGLGAGAAGAGAYALGHEKNKPETGDLRGEKPFTSSESATRPPATTSRLPVRENQAGPATTSTSGGYPTEQTPATDDRHTGRNAALAGAAGAGAGAYGAHEYNKHRADEDPSVGRRGPTTSAKDTKATPVAASSQPAVERSTRSDPTTAPEQDKSHVSRDAALAGAAGTGAGAYGAHEYKKHHAEQDPSTAHQAPIASTKDTNAPLDDTKATPIAATSGPTSEKAVKSDPTASEQEKSHTGRDAALAGAAGAGAGAYGAHEYSKHEAEQDAANAEVRRQKDLAEQEAARQKQFEKDQKAAEKQAHKEEKQHQKELEKEHKAQEKAAAKEEKKHQKELEKEEKKHDKELAAAEAERERHLKKEEQSPGVEAEEAGKHNRREKEAAAAAAVGGTGAAAAYGAHEHDQKSDAQKQHEQESLDTAYSIGKQSAASQGGRPAVIADDGGHNVLHKDPPQEEKKPNIFKRIFKRRKNKDTGEEEEYSTDEEDHGHGHSHGHSHEGRHAGEAGVLNAGVGTGAGVAGAEGTTRHEPGSTTTRTSTDQHHPHSSYEEHSGGLQKPSYNPFSKQSPTSADYGQQ